MDDLIERLVELEMRVSFQEQAITELSDALAEARAESARNALQLERVLADLGQMRGLLNSDPGAEPPPPHY
ncbi:SlyX family protein [Coralloluteibacterium stylophorae]|uniref:Protein SlyX homolog n=1 Tax=Coralloluteibacterium stylophorae TaxID=1776034 RepID=A0A8J7VUJ8_9GAMM|nr:SlyX family protein [Coralloluteibacterium stylophorae]MBS7456316.1 SlyX family protein [Coralloluteibacterium stylophorae]